MAQYDAVVTSLLPNGRAEIVIRPDKPGIPDAPEISRRVCHCATDGSMVRTEALNRADAQVGDWVSVYRKPGVVMKNVAALIGFPLAGVIAGTMLGSALGKAAMAIAALGGGLLGIVLGVRYYRHLSEENLMVIDRVIRSREELAAFSGGRAGCRDDCSQCIPWSSY